MEKLIIKDDEFVIAAFDIFESDRDEENLLDTLIRIVKIHCSHVPFGNFGGPMEESKHTNESNEMTAEFNVPIRNVQEAFSFSQGIKPLGKSAAGVDLKVENITEDSSSSDDSDESNSDSDSMEAIQRNFIKDYAVVNPVVRQEEGQADRILTSYKKIRGENNLRAPAEERPVD